MKDRLVVSEAILKKFLAALEQQTSKDPQKLMMLLAQLAPEIKRPVSAC